MRDPTQQMTRARRSPAGQAVNDAVEIGACIGLCTAASFSLTALPLAMVGAFSLLTVLPPTAILAIALFRFVGPRPVRIKGSPGATAAALAVIAVVTALGLAFPSQHFTTNRDPGIYSTAGVWLASDGGLLMPGIPDSLRGIDGISAAGAGFYDTRDDGRLYIQFAHLTHTLLGVADGLAGDRALVRTNVLVGGFALLLFFLVAQRLISAWPAVLATSGLALSLPQIYFTRGPYSEPLAQMLLVGALAVLVGRTALRPRAALLSGLLLGAMIGSRIDGVLILCAFVALVVYLLTWSDARDAPTASNARAVLWLALGTVVTGAIGIADLRLFSPVYLHDLWTNFHRALLAAVLGAVLGAVIVGAKRARAKVRGLVEPRRRLLADLAGGATALVLLAMAFARPLVQEAHGGESGLIAGLQSRQGLEVDPTRTYAELSVHWLAWFMGWPLVLASIVGAGLLVRRCIRDRDAAVGSVLVVLGLPTLVYLWQPSIYPDQIWAMRRFLPFTVPLSCLCAATVVDVVRARTVDTATPMLPRVGALVLAGTLLVPVVWTTAPFWDHREHRLTIGELEGLCTALQDNTTLVDSASNLGSQLSQPIAAACSVPVAHTDLSEESRVVAAREALAEEGETLYLVSARPDELSVDVRRVAEVPMTVNEMERRLLGAPSGLEPGSGQTGVLTVLEVLS